MVLQRGVQDEEQRNQVQSGVQVPGGAGGPEGRGERGRGPSGPDLGVHPVTLANWKRHFLQHGAEVFGGKEEVKAYEKRIAELERMLGQKEVEIALLKNF